MGNPLQDKIQELISLRKEGCVKNRNIVEKRMSPSQIEKAQGMARNWQPKK